MKKIFNYVMLATVAAAALVSCTKEQTTPEEPATPAMKTITITTDLQTKTTLDAAHENLGWSTGDKISVFNDQDDTNAPLTYAPSGYMTIEVPAGTTEIYGHYPYYSGNEAGPSSVSVYISNNQTQKNPGELAGSNYPMVAKGTVTGDNKANLVFYPVASALAINLYKTGLDGTEKVSKVVVTPTANTLFTGSQTTNITANNVTYTSAANSDPITVTLTNALSLSSSKPADSKAFDGQIYACLAKQSYTSVQFVITTNKGVYTITSNSTPFDCVNNDFVPVNINLSKAAFVPDEYPDEPTSGDCWYRVERPDWLAAGDRVVIVNHDGTQALGNVLKSNNRDGVSVGISTDGDYKKLTTTNDNMQVFIVEDGTVDDSFAFWCENGAEPSKYMYAASSSNNYLKFQDNKDGNASFVPTFAHGLGYLTAQGTNTRNVLRYNNSSGSNLFSCYSGTTNNDISIYKYYGTWAGSTTCADPTISQDGNTITLASTTPGVKIYYTLDGTTPTTSSTLYSAPFEIAGPVTVSAIATRSHYTNSGVTSQACSVKVATPVITGTGTGFTITCATEGAVIYYETSTSSMGAVATPTTSSNVYSSAVAIAATTYVKAYAVKASYIDSNVASATCEYSASSSVTYTFNTSAGLTELGITAPGTGKGIDLDPSHDYILGAITMNVTHGGTNTRIWNSSGTLTLRVYKATAPAANGTVSFDAGTGKTITKVEFTASSLTATPSTGTLSSKTWTGSSQTVSFECTANSTISTIRVTYQ